VRPAGLPRRSVPVTLTVLLLLVVLAGCGEAGGPSTPKPSTSPAPVRLVGLGDSVMAGFHCGCQGVPAEYAEALAQHSHRRTVSTNLGSNGLVTGQLLTALQHDARTRRLVRTADVVLVDIGANDLLPQLREWNRTSCSSSCFRAPAERMGDRVRQILTAITALRTASPDTVLVLNYWNVFTDGQVARDQGGQPQLDWSAVVTATANAAICRGAAAVGARCVDTVAPFKGDGSDDPTSLLAADGDHPNATGVRRIVSSLIAATPRQVLTGQAP
jgi:lysophospholipase L1-like esterase